MAAEKAELFRSIICGLGFCSSPSGLGKQCITLLVRTLEGFDPEFIEGSKGKPIMPSCFHILRLQPTRLYCGSTHSLEKRIVDHFAGRACRTTKIDPPIALVHSEEFTSFKEAFQREHRVRHWRRGKKEVLVSDDLQELKKFAKNKG